MVTPTEANAIAIFTILIANTYRHVRIEVVIHPNLVLIVTTAIGVINPADTAVKFKLVNALAQGTFEAVEITIDRTKVNVASTYTKISSKPVTKPEIPS